MAKYHRLAALMLIGGTGIVTAATFLWLSAPDLALTQLMVETVTTVLILLGLRWLPPRIESTPVRNSRSGACGGAVRATSRWRSAAGWRWRH
jgi:multicomponent K+:H+ antiporter subunit A